MALAVSPGIMAALLIAGLGVSASAAAAPGQMRGIELVQYGAQNPPPGYDNRGYDNRGRDDRDFDNRDRDRGRFGDDRDNRGGHKWRPGEVMPPELLGRVVPDWEERGLSRPPGGHQWVRVGLQFILVRGSDRKIARILNFD
jgi:Ni/Co efflux regulator RcnB